MGRQTGGQPQTDMIVFPQTQPDPKGTSHDREIPSCDRQVVDHYASPRPRSVSICPNRYPSRTHSATRDRNDFLVSSSAVRETRLDGTSTKSDREGDSGTSICACTRPATLSDRCRCAVAGGASAPSRRAAISCFESSPRSISVVLPSRMAGLLLRRRGVGEFGPDALPVVGAQVAARHFPDGEALNRDGSLGGDGRQPRCHLRQVGRRDGQSLGQARGCAPRAIRDVGFQVHAPSLVCTKRHGQVFTNLVAYKLVP